MSCVFPRAWVRVHGAGAGSLASPVLFTTATRVSARRPCAVSHAAGPRGALLVGSVVSGLCSAACLTQSAADAARGRRRRCCRARYAEGLTIVSSPRHTKFQTPLTFVTVASNTFSTSSSSRHLMKLKRSPIVLKSLVWSLRCPSGWSRASCIVLSWAFVCEVPWLVRVEESGVCVRESVAPQLFKRYFGSQKWAKTG